MKFLSGLQEEHSQVTLPVQPHDQRPVKAKDLDQVITRLNQVGGDQPLGKEIDDGEQEQWFVGEAGAGGRTPVGAVGRDLLTCFLYCENPA